MSAALEQLTPGKYLQLSMATGSVPRAAGVNGVDVGSLRAIVAQFFWDWYQAHQDDVVIKRRVFGPAAGDLEPPPVSLHELRPLFERLFGPTGGAE